MRTTTQTRPNTSPALRALRVSATLAVLALLLQFVSAGQLFTGSDALDAHGAGAIVLHVVSGLAALAAWWHRHRDGASTGLAVLATAAFAATFVQAALGSHATLATHVPGALVLTVGSVWVLARAFSTPGT